MSVIGGKADMTRTGRDGDAPMLVAIDGIDGIDRFPDQEKLNFLAKAWRAAHQKARAIGWLRS
jgi:hypothetical protein